MEEAVIEQFFANIDKLETNLIQHVRTSSLSKERELFLIDEVLGTPYIISTSNWMDNLLIRTKKDSEAALLILPEESGHARGTTG